MDLLRVHIYEYSIRFDKRVNDAIQNLPKLNSEVIELNELWKSQKISEKQILYSILNIIGKYGNYLQDFYFHKDELDSNGCFIDNTLQNFLPEYNPEDDKKFFFEYFNDQGALKKVSKKKFETEIPNEEIANEYVENYVFKGAKFYVGSLEEDKFTSNWYFMVVDNLVKMAYEKITH